MQGWDGGPLQPSKNHVVEKQVNVRSAVERWHRKYALREYRITLEQDVAKLRRKLKQEIDTHKALERAFKRTLGVLPRFSPGLTPKIQELLAEVAVLEEEVINLEECIVTLRQGLYNEALYLSDSRQQHKEKIQSLDPLLSKEKNCPTLQSHHLQNVTKGKRNSVIAKLLPPVTENKTEGSHFLTGRPTTDGEPKRKPSKSFSYGSSSFQKSSLYGFSNGYGPSSLGDGAMPRINMLYQDKTIGGQKMSMEKENKKSLAVKSEKPWFQASNSVGDKVKPMVPKAVSSFLDTRDTSEPNILSEEMVWYLSTIFVRLSRSNSYSDFETPSTVSHSMLSKSVYSFTSRNSLSYYPVMDITEEMEVFDPYWTCTDSTPRDIGPYKYYHEITTNTLDYQRIPRSSSFFQKLMGMVRKLSTVDLRGLTHQQKLAFWINIYNVCMMHAFLEHGIPNSPHKVVALMGKAVINVGGHFLSALAIEHFILRLPSNLENGELKSREREGEAVMGSTYGLEWPEPLVSFALCCGSWSSPAVRVYTALEVERELECAKTEYLQAAVGVTPTRVVIPKLLDWYMRDFAKDAGSLVQWVSKQLPSSLGRLVERCLANMNRKEVSEVVEVMPYNFSFRYLFTIPPL